MRALAGIAIAVALTSAPATAEPLPSGSMGIIVGAVAGTGADASRLGVGYLDPFSFHAAWQPMTTESRIGWALRWTTMFTSTYGASAAEVADLQTMQMDFTLGARIRPWGNVRRYLTVRAGPALFRANQTIPPKMQRAFIGPVASIGFEQYIVGSLLLLDFDLRYGLITNGPSQIVFTAGISIAGP